MPRKFALLAIDDFDNEIDRFNLDTVSDLKGLGFEIDYTSIESRLTTVFFSAKEKRVATQLNIVFEYPNAYVKSGVFRAFVQKYTNKRLIVEYNNTQEILNWEGKITKYTFSELSKTGDLECSISFLPSSPKYIRRDNVITIKLSNKGLSFPFKFPFCFGQNIVSNNILKNNYFDRIPLRIFIFGAITSPQITLVDKATNQVYSRISFTGRGGLDVAADEHLLIDSITNKVLLFKSGAYQNAYDYLENSNDYDTFAWARESTESEININLQGQSGYLKASYREYRL